MSSALAGGADTIVALASGASRAALAVVRVSGPAAESIAGQVCPAVDFRRPRRAVLTAVHGSDGAVVDTGVAIAYRAPRSFTGEDQLEVTVHGSPYVVRRVVESCVEAGARPAEAGEFTRRAVANGKIDLVQAEAIRDLVAVDTESQLRNAQRQLAGDLSASFRRLRQTLVTARAGVEAQLEFEAQGVEVHDEALRLTVAEGRRELEDLLATAGAGRRVREGVRVAILGPVNSGKSTLFNHLCGSARAIVSPHPGTTRDVIEAALDIDGVPITVADTAGLRESENDIEAEGLRRARAAGAEADVVVWMESMDVAAGHENAPPARPGLEVIRVGSKSDLAPGQAADAGWLRVSCHTGEGTSALRERLRAAVMAEVEALGERVAIGARHQAALARALAELDHGVGTEPEVVAEALRWATRELEMVLGEVTSEEILDEVFRGFCVGK